LVIVAIEGEGIKGKDQYYLNTLFSDRLPTVAKNIPNRLFSTSLATFALQLIREFGAASNAKVATRSQNGLFSTKKPRHTDFMKLVTFTTTSKNFAKPNKYRRFTSSFAKVKKKKRKQTNLNEFDNFCTY